MNLIIIDDEPLALDILETYIDQIPDLTLVGKCHSAIEARELLKERHIDAMFLDIQMPELTGIEFVKTLPKPPKVIFTTAYPNFALEGFELNAVDYLLKPISFERFQKAVEKLRQTDKHSFSEPVQATATSADFIFVKADKKFIKANFEDILYIEGLKDYVIIKTVSGRIITLQTMKSLEEKLPKSYFLRVHRSYIVNVRKINAIVGNMIEIGEKLDAKLIPIGKNYRDYLAEMIDENRL